MNSNIKHYYNSINICLLKALGIWHHHDKSRLVLLQRVVIILVLVPHLCMQFTVFVTEKYTMMLFIRVTALACPFAIMVMKYIVFIFKSDVILNMHSRMEEDWMLMRDNIEYDIIQKNAHSAHFFVILTLSFTCFVVAALVFLQFLPNVFDIILPLDEPRQREFLLRVEYFVSRDKYFYTILLHEIAFIVICAAVIFSTSMQLLVFLFHSFGMFKITGHRIRYFTDDSASQLISNFENERAICKKIMHAVIAHRRALEFSNIIISSFNAPYCVIAILGVISLSINLFGIIEAITISKIPQNAVLYVLSVLGHLIYMFAAMFVGQKITDCNDEVFNLTYDTSWYLMPVSSQKLVLFLMQKAGKEFCLTIGYLLVAKIENFAALVNASLSYVAVMYSCTH